MTLGKEGSNILSENTQKIFQQYTQLSTDEKLALLYFIYENMGDSITPAAPNAADLNLTSSVIEVIFNLSEDEQLEIMRDIVNCKDTEYSRAYGGLTPNNQLLVWYAWAQAMGDTVVDLPDDYKATEAISNVLSQIKKLEFEEQISVLREIASNMGYTEVKRVSSQAEVGITPSL
ncbi:orange carotenoid protein [Hydrococcus rivularis NIES-593]|uniref:Orange carotenoid protein n=1 Tax=Hydrococcus rivularis NIES-593 TaxID=1921803 RepID=A0A1U7HMX1_9CYAN|nr:orange carotenoid protein N-terminal domain-containing protein [Hydrococcus rivularis]OKH24917.1 orange carotenoid protein [Hydrococcus rivularis NIES-593]